MTATMPPRDWTHLHWTDITPAAAAGWIAVLPLAATEQHGPHLPLGADVMIAEAYVAEVRHLLPPDIPAIFLPVLPVGISTEHIAYPGTLTLPAEVAIRSWMSLGESVARTGIRKLVMVSSHGGNSAAISVVAQDLRARYRMLAVATAWSRFGTPDGLFSGQERRHGIHGGAIETSIMLAACPDLVRADRIGNFQPGTVAMDKDYRWLNAGRPAPFAWQAQDLHRSGAVGDATAANADKGRRLLAHGARSFCELLVDVHQFNSAMFDDWAPANET